MKRVLALILALGLIAAPASWAHPGRTDSRGGHKDNKNKSGLGSYHYHCNGSSAHLHSGGSCPYGSSGKPAKSTGSGSSSTSGGSTSTPPADIPVESIRFELPQQITVGDSLPLTALVLPADATQQALEWQSDNSAVASADDATLTAKSPGKATITAKAVSGASHSAQVEVLPLLAQEIVILSPAQQLDVGSTLPLALEITPENATNRGAGWVSSNPKVATVSKDGLVTGQAPGNVTILATVDNVTTPITLEVLAVQPTGILMSPDLAQRSKLRLAETLPLSAVLSPSNVTDSTVEWSVSDSAIATIEGGVLYPQKTGQVLVTATTANGLTCQLSLQVIDPARPFWAALGIFILAGGGYALYRYRKIQK